MALYWYLLNIAKGRSVFKSLPHNLKEPIQALIDTYRSIDIHAILARSKAEAEWQSIIVKIRLTKDSTTKLKENHDSKEKKLGMIRRDKFKLVLETREISCLNNILSELQNGVVTLDGDQTNLIGNDFRDIFDKQIINSSLYVDPGEKCGYLHKMTSSRRGTHRKKYARREPNF
jgi:hypothetical protein